MDRRHFLAGSGAAAMAISLEPGLALAQTSGDEALRGIIDTIFAGEMQLSPMSQTSLGLDSGVNSWARSRLDDYSLAGDAAAARLSRRRLADIKAVDESSLSETWLVRKLVVEDMLEQGLVSDDLGINHLGAPYRLSQQDGADFSIPDFLDSQHPVETADDAEAYLARLAAFPFALDDQSEAQRYDASRGISAPRWSLDLVDGQISGLLEAPPEESGMTRSLASRAEEAGIGGDWAARAAAIVENDVYPALRRQLELVRRLKRSTRRGDGVWRIPNGGEIYEKALRYYTTTDMTADEVHQVGLEQVAEISAELDGILRGTGLTEGTVGERLNQLNVRPDQVFPNTDQGREELLASIRAGMDAMDAKLSSHFATLPDQPLDLRRVPVEIQDGASNGYYSIAALDGSRPAIYWINLKDTGDWPKYQIPSLTYHEGNPGHHLHLTLLQQDDSLPLLLKNYWLSAYGEGWALYAEMLAEEMDGYQGLEKAGALQSWLFRAARLVVDTGLNAKRWSVERATEYLVDTVAFTRPRSQREIERYCASPGQACSYKIGQNVWVEQREKAQAALGDAFDIRQFHEILKEGVMTLALLEQRVDAWIARVRGG